MNICTIIARNYVAHARILAESFRAIHPEGTCSVLVIDDPSGYIDADAEPFELLTIDQIGLPGPERMAASYDVVEFSTAVKPWLMRTLLDRPGADSVVYLDPDIRIFDSIAEVGERAERHGVVLTPHFTAPLPRDGRKPSEEDILIAGAYNLGFIALGKSETADALLAWWSERLANDCLNEPEIGHFVDQRWIDLAPGMWPGIDVLRDTAYNIAYWNLPTRSLEEDGSGYRVDGAPLRFFHFSGFDPRRPEELSKHQNRIDVAAEPALGRILREYADQLLAHGFAEASGWPYGWNEMGNGVALDRPARRVYREAVEAGEFKDSVFSREGGERFVEFLDRPHGAIANGGVNLYARAVWESRPDFRAHFPDISGERGSEFVGWLRQTAADTGISAELLPEDPSPNGTGPAPASAPAPGDLQKGVNLVGYLSSARGVGEAARQVLATLERGNIKAARVDAPPDPAELDAVLGRLSPAEHPYDVNLICVNADMLPPTAKGLGEEFFAGRHSIGLWFWEISEFPVQLKPAFQHVDEVWVASEHVARALRPLSPVPVTTIRLPVTPTPPPRLNRAELGLPEGFCFLFVFDYRSVFRRKNPLGLVEAFRAAFEPGAGPSLVIKSVCGDEFPAERELLAAAVEDRPEIHLIEEKVSAAEKDAMIASCDCYVSLHRSEGLGLTMAEAMYFERPVIATGYSGNLDFMTKENSYLVPHTMAQIGDDAPPYPPQGEWAEPDLDQAAALMRRVCENGGEATERGRRAALDLRRTHSLEAALGILDARLAHVRRQRLERRLEHPIFAAPAATARPTGRGQLEDLLKVAGAPPPTPGSGRLRSSLKRLYLRALRPYASYQQRVNSGTVQAIDELREMLRDAIELDDHVDAKAAATQRQLENLVDDVKRDEGRLLEADELVRAAAAQPYMADDRLAPRRHPLLGETMGFRTEAAGGEGYRSFEDLFRGPEPMIRDRQRVYLDLVAGHAPVLDLGCGRGEFLDLLAERNIEFQGVDLDPDMVRRCHEKGYASVRVGDAIEFLEEAKPGSLGTIFSAQVVEHLPFEQLQRLLELGLSRLKPGGLLIAETVNPHSARALKAFWVDPTHQHPLFPEVMLSLSETAGYVRGDVFAPVGTGDWEVDRTLVGEYAVVAVAPETRGADSAEPSPA